uniref:Amine oxidase, flavin-containing n=1 Tax=mine drainage metagenome TaxID=410659 RepID=E6Q3C6_9ZZZZ
MHPVNAIVVGAGIAGLGCAWELKRAGFRVTVLERSDAVGGRIRSERFHGRDIEVGAQFPSTGYRYLLPLMRDTGMLARLVKSSPWGAVERNHTLHAVHARRPWTMLTGGLLGVGEYGTLALGSAAPLWQSRRLNPSDYARLAALDDADAAQWCATAMGAAARDYVFEPMIHGFYFHRLSGTSRALVAALLAFNGADALAVAGGWQALPIAMAAQLDVRYGAEVDAIEETPEGVRVGVGGESLVADRVILACPADVSRALLPYASEAEQVVLAAGYASSIHVAFALRQTWKPPDHLRGIHGALAAPREGGSIAAPTFESGRLPGSDGGEVLAVMLGNDAARRAMNRPDDELIRDTVEQLNRIVPKLPAAIVETRVQRWPIAEPLSPVGRARAVAAYRRSLGGQRRVVLAGDYLGSPWTDGAAETGKWAARHIIASIANGVSTSRPASER